MLGMIYYGAFGVQRDYGEAAMWWRKAADQANAKALATLGTDHNGGGVPP
jgi:TPR repeat protein